jgi:lipopolysaccharide biosynthesis regulator YciM
MSKTMCEIGKKKAKERLMEKLKYECKKCHTRVKQKDWVCKPGKL